MRNRLETSLILLLLAAGSVWGGITASISGTVTDPTGGVIPGAVVTAHNTETGIDNSTRTNAQGFYSFPALPPGKYEVRIKIAGFEEYQQADIVLDVNNALRIDAVMTVGTVTQQVSVTANAAHVETSNTQMGDIIGSAKMLALPLNGRSYLDLIGLQPGVAPASSGDGPSSSISGQRETSNGFMINGGAAMDRLWNAPSITPNLDSIAEFRVLTNNADAEYGDYGGGLINVVTKSGTNDLHGSAFEFLRNPDFDSRNFYSPVRGVLHQNQFGGTGGGPIKHDKLFFFSDYQGTRLVQGVDTGLIPVPSAADHEGNLSDISNQLTGSVTGAAWAGILANGLGYPVNVGEPYYASGCTSSAACVFPNAVIPQSIFTAPSTFLMKYIPLPNLGSDFTTSAFKGTTRDDMGSARIDANTHLGLVTGYYYIDDNVSINPYGGATLPGFATSNNGRNQMVSLGLTHSFGPISINELHLSYMRNVLFQGYPVGGVGPTVASQGFTGIVPDPTLSLVEYAGFNNYSLGASTFFNKTFENTYQVSDNFSKVIGTHILKIGGSFHYDQVTVDIYAFHNGSFTFNGMETGSDFADFLIGAPSSYSQGLQLPVYTRARYYNLFAQDSWRATPHLTLNYGLRWEVSTPWWEAHNELVDLEPGDQSKTFPGAPLGYVFPGDPGIPRTQTPTRYNNFAPRLGLAYSPHAEGGFLGKVVGPPGRMSIRAAYGIYYTSYEDLGEKENGAAPFGYFYVSPTPALFATPFIDRETGNNEGQRFPIPIPPLNASPSNPDSSINWAEFVPIAYSPGLYLGDHNPYNEDYTISIQRQFGGATLLSLSYVGAEGHRLLGMIESNPGNPALCLSLSQPSEVMPGTSTCGPLSDTGLFYPATGGSTTVRQRFGPEIGGNGWWMTIANSNYNSLQVSLRRTVGRLEFLAGYTYSKSIDNASGDGLGQGDNLNPLNPKLTRGLSAFDVAHNFVTSYNYRIPFDKLWRPNRLTGGWQIAGITRFATGFPVYLQENDDNSLLGTCSSGYGNCVDAPNYTPGNLKITDPRKAVLPNSTYTNGLNPYFNNTLFSPEAIGHLGTANRRFFTGPGLNNWSMSLIKDLRLTESKHLQFRGELFNAFNHAQFGAPQGSILAGPTFGFVSSANPARIGQVAMKFIF